MKYLNMRAMELLCHLRTVIAPNTKEFFQKWGEVSMFTLQLSQNPYLVIKKS